MEPMLRPLNPRCGTCRKLPVASGCKSMSSTQARAKRPLRPNPAGARRRPAPHRRYGRRSTIITSQIPVDKWHELIGDPTYADAILDRIVHNAHRIDLTGHSLRRSRATKQQRSDLPPDAKTAVDH